MATLTKAEIFRRRLPLKEVDVPEWGGAIYVRALSIGEAIKLNADDVSAVDYVLMVACDADGNALFTEEDRAELEKCDARVVAHVFKAGAEFNSLSVDDEKKD